MMVNEEKYVVFAYILMLGSVIFSFPKDKVRYNSFSTVRGFLVKMGCKPSALKLNARNNFIPKMYVGLCWADSSLDKF